MSQITLKGNPIETVGELPAVGTQAPSFKLVRADLSEAQLSDFAGKWKILSIFPSLDTGVCATSVKMFNQRAAALDDVVILNVSKDLPFAQGRFCQAEDITAVETLSAFRSNFARDYGVEITTGPLSGLCARAIVLLDPDDKVIYTELVPEIAQEPDYEAALSRFQR